MFDETLEKAKEVWQPYYTQILSQKEAGEIVENWAAYINLLSEWAQLVNEKNE